MSRPSLVIAARDVLGQGAQTFDAVRQMAQSLQQIYDIAVGKTEPFDPDEALEAIQVIAGDALGLG